MSPETAIATCRARWDALAARPVDPADVEERIAIRLEGRPDLEVRCMPDHGAVRLFVLVDPPDRWRSAYVRSWREADAVLDRLLGVA